ncbi:MAG TPA: SpvB/TcaC N-terminal domain-containing protein, partial [Chloroflexota bacterium]|nr:SpvB/TcaC N-terminal domain-containing protein [Chloroflexota bacterium]
MTTPGNLSEQILALPGGAGEVRPAGQTFDVRPHSGTGGYAIPLETKPGHAGLTPALALVYSTHAGDGIAGVGWALSVGAVERRTDRGLPRFDDHTDTFTLGGDELLPAGAGAYRLRIESRFERIRHVSRGGLDSWVVAARDGSRVFYGSESDHRLHDGPARIGAWYPSKRQDANGNEIVYAYLRHGATRDVRLHTVEWGGCYRVLFVYEARPDPLRSFRPGFEHLQQHRLARVDVEVRATPVAPYRTYQQYRLSYAQSALTGRSLLAEVGITGIGADGSRRELPPVSLGYARPDLARRTWLPLGGALPGGSLRDGNLTLACQSGSGRPDIFETTATGHWLRENLGGGRFGPPRRVPSPAQVLLEDPGVFISDMRGDGFGDLVVDGGRRVYE